MTSGVTVDKREIIENLYKNGGVITRTARAMGINPDTIYDWSYKDPEVAFAIENSRERHREQLRDQDGALVEEAYKSMNYLLKGNDVTATIFTLKAKAKWAEFKKEEQLNKSLEIKVIQKPWKDDKNNNDT
jgi:hypothetical protein